jgi:hypothetical protein
MDGVAGDGSSLRHGRAGPLPRPLTTGVLAEPLTG